MRYTLIAHLIITSVLCQSVITNYLQYMVNKIAITANTARPSGQACSPRPSGLYDAANKSVHKVTVTVPREFGNSR